MYYILYWYVLIYIYNNNNNCVRAINFETASRRVDPDFCYSRTSCMHYNIMFVHMRRGLLQTVSRSTVAGRQYIVTTVFFRPRAVRHPLV